MSRAVAILFFAAALVCVINALPQNYGPPGSCPTNEEFTSCGSSCQPSCAQPKSQVCTLACKIGCQCKSGYLRNNGGQCVLPQECN